MTSPSTDALVSSLQARLNAYRSNLCLVAAQPGAPQLRWLHGFSRGEQKMLECRVNTLRRLEQTLTALETQG